jgi:hypothetical protein
MGMDDAAMPTYTKLPRFQKDFDQLSADDQELFRQAVEKFIEDLKRGRGFRPGLRVRGVQGAPGIYEMTWAPDGRATFNYGESLQEGEAHVVWRRVGSHAILANA